MKRILLLATALLAITSQHSFAQDSKPWKLGGQGMLTYNQVGLSNWAAGGQSNMTLIGNLNLHANRTWLDGEDKVATWENSLDLAYGFIKNNRNGRNTFLFDPDIPITKAEDRIEFVSKYGRKAWSDKFQYSGLVNFWTQFDYGRTNPTDATYISRFLSPAYLSFAAGLDYKPNSDWSFFFSPASGKVTIVGDDSLANAGAFGVNQLVNPEDQTSNFLPGNGAKSRIEVGATARVGYNKKWGKIDPAKEDGAEGNERFSFLAQLDLFSNYIDRPQNIDVRGSVAFVARLNKYLSVNFFANMIYDHDIKIGRVNEDGDPIYSGNSPEFSFDNVTYNTSNDPSENITWATYDENGDINGTILVPKRGAALQVKEVFGVGLVYAF